LSVQFTLVTSLCTRLNTHNAYLNTISTYADIAISQGNVATCYRKCVKEKRLKICQILATFWQKVGEIF